MTLCSPTPEQGQPWPCFSLCVCPYTPFLSACPSHKMLAGQCEGHPFQKCHPSPPVGDTSYSELLPGLSFTLWPSAVHDPPSSLPPSCPCPAAHATIRMSRALQNISGAWPWPHRLEVVCLRVQCILRNCRISNYWAPVYSTPFKELTT